MTNVINLLTNISVRVSSIRNINAGGCGVFAAAVGEHLQHLVPMKIRVFDISPCPSLNVVEDILNEDIFKISSWTKSGVYFGHVMIEFIYKGQVYLYDSDGVKQDSQTFYNMKKSGGDISLRAISGLAARREAWNFMFDRTNIPLLCAIIDSEFERNGCQLYKEEWKWAV